MTNQEPKGCTTFSNICVVILRELRMERGIHQAQVADWIGKTPSTWTKIESGKSPLQFDTFVKVCNSFQVMPSSVMATAERYALLLSQSGWAVITSDLESDDEMLNLAQQYWASPKSRSVKPNYWGAQSILNGPIYLRDSIQLAPVFHHIIDPEHLRCDLIVSD